MDFVAVLLFWNWFGSAVFTAFIAGTKNRNEGYWFFGGLVFGLIALLAIGLSEPTEKKEKEQEA